MQQRVHYQPTDPGIRWEKDPGIVIDVSDVGGNWRSITPNVIEVGAGFRMYYTESGPGLDYGSSPARILSAISHDGTMWEPELGVRIAPYEPGPGLRVVCPDVVPLLEGGYRRYFEGQPHNGPSTVMSAYSDEGIVWKADPGIRWGDDNADFGSPRCIYVESNEKTLYRLYFHQSSATIGDKTIVSALSEDGLHFQKEPGVRIVQETPFETATVYAPEVLYLGDGTYRMYYAGWSSEPLHGQILSATSSDGLNWTKDAKPSVVFGGRWDQVKCSEPCIMRLPDGCYRMFYEANDEHGVWRILSATTPA